MPNVNLNINARDNASAPIQKVTGSMIKANLAAQAITMAITALTKAVKDSIAAYAEQEKAEAQLNAVLKSTKQAAGLTATELKNMAASLQSVSTYGDEAIIKSQALLLTFTKIGKDTFPEAQQAILNMSAAMGTSLQSATIQVGKALQDPIQGVAALRRVGVQLSEQQQQLVKDLVATGDTAGAQKIILGELETQFGGVAEAMRNTYSGAKQAFENASGDVMEQYGRIVGIIGKDLYNALTRSAEAQVQFLSSAEGLDRVNGIIAGLKAGFIAFKNVIAPFLEAFKTVVMEVKSSAARFKELNDGSGKAGLFLKMTTGIVKIAAVSFSLMGKTISLVIGLIVDLVKILQTAGRAIGAAMAGDFQTASRELKNLGSDFQALGKNAKNNVDNIVRDVKNFGAEMKKGMSADEIKKQWKTDMEAIKTTMAESQDDITQTVENANDKIIEDTKGTAQEVKYTWENALNDISSAARQGFEAIIGYQNQGYDQQKDALSRAEAARLAILEKSTAAQIAEVDAMQAARIIGTKTAEQRRTEIEAGAEAAREQLRRETAENVYKIELKQFQMNRAAGITNAAVNTALGVTKALSSAIPPFNVILAGITAAAGAVQIATIAAQTPPPRPSFATGGVMPYSGTALVGERGRELVELPAGARVLPNSATERQSQAGIVINTINIYANNPVDFQRQLLKQVNRYELGRV